MKKEKKGLFAIPEKLTEDLKNFEGKSFVDFLTAKKLSPKLQRFFILDSLLFRHCRCNSDKDDDSSLILIFFFFRI